MEVGDGGWCRSLGFKATRIHSHHLWRSVLRCLFNFKSPLSVPLLDSTQGVTSDFHVRVVRGCLAFPLANPASQVLAARKCVSHPTLLAQGQNIMCLKMVNFLSGLPSPTLVPHLGIRLESQRSVGNLFSCVHPTFLLVQCPVSDEIIHETLNRVDKSYSFPLEIPSGFKSLPSCCRGSVFYGSSPVGFEIFAYQIYFSASGS